MTQSTHQLNKSLAWVFNQRLFSFWAHEPQVYGRHTRSSWYHVATKNRYVRFISISLAVLLQTALVYSWQPFSSMLFADQAYGYKCTQEDYKNYFDRIATRPSAKYEQVCSQQNTAIQLLYNLYTASEFVSGAIAGVMFDYIGPFLTGLAGQFAFFLGLITLIVSNNSLDLYILSMILLGAAANLIVYSSLALSDYFLEWESLILSILIALQTGGSVVTTILDQIYRTTDIDLSRLFALYTVICLPVGLYFLVTLPLIRLALNPKSQRHFEQLILTPSPIDDHSTAGHQSNLAISTYLSAQDNQSSQSAHMPDEGIIETRSTAQRTETPSDQMCESGANVPHDHHVKNTPVKKQLSFMEAKQISEQNSANPRGLNPTTPCLQNESVTPCIPNSSFSRSCSIISSLNSEHVPRTQSIEPKIIQDPDTFTLIAKETFPVKSVLAYLLSPEYIIFICLVISFTLHFNYYPVVLRTIAGDDIARFNGYIYPTQAFWGIFFGVIVVYTKTLPILGFLFFLAALVYAFSLSANTACLYIASVIFVIATTYVYTAKFTFVAEFYPPRYSGVLLGVLSIASGLTLGINILLLEIESTYHVMVGMLISAIVCILATSWIWYRMKRIKPTFKSIEKV